MSIALLLSCLVSIGHCNDDFMLTGSEVGFGGGTSIGTDFSITGILSQPIVEVSTGGDFAVSSGLMSGYWGCTFDLYELEELAAYWLDSNAATYIDFNADYKVDMLDFAIMAVLWDE